MEWLAYGIPTIVLLTLLIYAANRAGWFSKAEKRQIDANTDAAQHRDDDPQKRPQKRAGGV